MQERIRGITAQWDLRIFLVVLFAIEIGALVRWIPVASADFPLNDGGLFYVMVRDLQHAGYALPLFTSYNSAQIPFAYPPLSFYAAGLLSDYTGHALLDVIRLFPVVMSILTLPVFYILSRAILSSRTQAILALFVFALVPRAYNWEIMGGGLTRSPGFLFALLSLYQVYLLYTQKQQRFIVTGALFAALTVLTHLEMAWFVACSSGILFLFYARNRRSFMHSLALAGGVTVLTAPWWGTILVRHGLSPFVAAAFSAPTVWYASLILVVLNFTEEAYAAVWAVLGVLGVVVCIARRKYILPFWFLALFLVDPRKAATVSMVPLAMLVGIAIDQLVWPGIERANELYRLSQTNNNPHQVDSSGVTVPTASTQLLKIGVVAFFVIHSLLSSFAIPINAMSVEEREAMEWVAQNTPQDSQFIVLAPAETWARDYTVEWFPMLAQRASNNTVQGYEWLPGMEYRERWDVYDSLKGCVAQDADCLEQIAANHDLGFTHIYVSKAVRESVGTECCIALRESLRVSPDFDLVFDESGAVIFARNDQIAYD